MKDFFKCLTLFLAGSGLCFWIVHFAEKFEPKTYFVFYLEDGEDRTIQYEDTNFNKIIEDLSKDNIVDYTIYRKINLRKK